MQKFQKITRRTLTNDRSFSELVILVVKGNAALSDVQGISLYLSIFTRRFAPRAASAARYARSQGRIEQNASE